MSNHFFPYRLRENQREAIEFLTQNLHTNVCIHAPTGFGKTPVILSSLLNVSKKLHYKIIWAVKTGNEIDRPIEELKVINAMSREKIFGLSYRGKKDMCLLLKDLKFQGVSSDDVTYICRKRKKSCKYYLNFLEFSSEKLEELVKEPILYSELLNFAEKNEICAYELQKFLLDFATVIALNYNYIIDDAISWAIRSKLPFSECFLVVDEAHNLQRVVSSINSDRISLGSLHFALLEIEEFDDECVKNVLLRMQDEMLAMKERVKDEAELNPQEFLKKVCPHMNDLMEVLSSMKRYGLKVRKERLKNGKIPRSSLFHLSNFWNKVLENIHTDGVAFLVTRKGDNLIFEMWDMRSAEILKDKWDEYISCIFCSGTLNPIDAFAETIGLKDYKGRHFSFTFGEHIISLITGGLTTRGECLEEEMINRYLETINNFIEHVNTNIAIFSASYRVQNDLIRSGLRNIIEENGREFFLEREGMDGRSARKTLDRFKACADSEKKGVLCATMFGRFAEGADFPGEELVGVFLVGIPFDRLTIRTKLYLDYYKKLYGKQKGTYFGYIVPALRRASQALGRALRSKDDRAVFLLGDERYAEKRFFHLLPDFIKNNCRLIHFKDVSRFLSGQTLKV